MFVTFLFIVIFYLRENKNRITYINYEQDMDYDIDYDIDEIINDSNKPINFDKYWNDVFHELMEYIYKFIALIFCLYIDINYIYYNYFL